MKNFKRYSKQTFSFCNTHWRGVAGLVLISCLVDRLRLGNQFVAGDESFSWYLLLVNMVVANVFYLVSIFYVDDRANNKQTNWVQFLILAIKFIIPFTMLMLLVFLLAGISALAFIIPGIYVLVKYSFAGFNLLLDKTSITGAGKLSWEQTTGYGWTLLSGVMVFILVPTIISELSITYLGSGILAHSFSSLALALGLSLIHISEPTRPY